MLDEVLEAGLIIDLSRSILSHDSLDVIGFELVVNSKCLAFKFGPHHHSFLGCGVLLKYLMAYVLDRLL
jgi:hypothetical protein